jgi:tRNA pseudouridine38-40 synthase
MTRNIKLTLEYDGTNYYGWQFQKEQPTVQGTLEKAIYSLTGENVRVTAAGRTDTGVHARGQVVNFFLKKQLALHNIKMGLNAYLPKDIVVVNAEEAPDTFNARFDAKQRIYQYYIYRNNTALYRNYCWQIFFKFDAEILNSLATEIVGEHDFGAFCRVEAQTKHKICRVTESYWRTENGFLIYRVAANRFLHGMVRTLVGTMIDVAKGRFTKEQFLEILISRDRTKAGLAAPSQGLVLDEVVY